MAYKVLYRKYRPIDFDNVVGQEYTVSMLKNAIINGKTSHAYIFTGPRGTGKTSSAKIFAKALNCEDLHDGNPCGKCNSCLSFDNSPDIIELDAASNNGVDDIREIINNVKLVPSELKYKIYIIDEVHMLSPGAFNALLLTLEEPPEHVVFILATTEIQKVPITILSRCQRFDFKPIDKDSMVERLKSIAKKEKIKITDDALEEISLISAGGMRDALGILDQLSANNEKITVEIVTDNFGSVANDKIESIIKAIDSLDTDKLVGFMESIRNSGTNYNVFLEKLILNLRNKAIDIKLGNSLNSLYYEDIYNMIVDLNELMAIISINVNPYVLIEIVLLKYIKNNKLSTVFDNQNYFPGNNFDEKSVKTDEKDSKNYFPGNNLSEKKDKISEKKENKNSLGNNFDSLGNNFENLGNTDKVAKKPMFDINIRINNCFAEADKKIKNDVLSRWVDFFNYLMSNDRSIVSLLADTTVLAASSKYVLIQSKNDSTNTLINQDIVKIENYYKNFNGSEVRFAALNDDLWKKEVEKYRINVKNKIKYNYIEEEVLSTEEEVQEVNQDDIESVAKDIFDSYEIIE